MQDVDAVAVLAEPQRRKVFEYLQSHPGLTVAELADELGVGRTLVVHHVARLADAGLVESAGPAARGRGRPAQRYRVARRDVAVTVPERRYDLLAEILLDSVAENGSRERAQRTALRVARAKGREIARSVKGRGLPAVERLLTGLGYVPRRERDRVTVQNCPFDRFRATRTEQVCALNLALCEGYLEGLDAAGVTARLEPTPEACCVVFERQP